MNRLPLLSFKYIVPLTLALSAATACFAQAPRSKHVYIVAEENRSYEEIVGSPNMPYLNSLLAQGALATQFYANEHGSLENYFWVTSGQFITHDNTTLQVFNVDNIERHLLSHGLTFKSYAQSLPFPGFTGLTSGAYLKRHAPLPYFAEMGDSSLIKNHVSSVQMAQDIADGALPNFAFITPDANHDIHNCVATLPACMQAADLWLKQNIGPLLATPEFQPGGDGLLILWSDEADLITDNRCSAMVSTGCGGRVVVAMVGPQVKKGFKSVTTYHHPSVLRTMLEALGTESNFPAAAETAPDMAEFFKTTPGGSGGAGSGISVVAPLAGSVTGTSVHMEAGASGQNPIVAMRIYVDDQSVFLADSNHLDTFITLPLGQHSVIFQAWDSKGNILKALETITVK